GSGEAVDPRGDAACGPGGLARWPCPLFGRRGGARSGFLSLRDGPGDSLPDPRRWALRLEIGGERRDGLTCPGEPGLAERVRTLAREVLLERASLGRLESTEGVGVDLVEKLLVRHGRPVLSEGGGFAQAWPPPVCTDGRRAPDAAGPPPALQWKRWFRR